MLADDPDDLETNLSNNESLGDVVKRALSRRAFLRGSLSTGVLFTGGAALLAACGDDASGDPDATPSPDGSPDGAPGSPDAGADASVPPMRPTALGFDAVAKSTDDVLTVAAGYTATILFKLGDPMAAGVPAYTNLGTDAVDTYDRRAGDHHDGMHFFGMGTGGTYDPKSPTRGLLVMNHEAITRPFVHPNGQSIEGSGVAARRTVAAEVDREFFLHGVSVIEVNRAAGGGWSYAVDSSYNRRIHTLTPMELSGPLRGHASMVTKYSPDGTRTRGTVNNCANGWTPWGTYLTCEENWNSYFRRVTDANRSAKEIEALRRYGIAANNAGRELWATVTPDPDDNRYGRWNIEATAGAPSTDYRNAVNTYGWVVEIDPFASTSTPKKRTALGRFAHEGAVFAAPIAGKPLVVYSGDDQANDYMYKFVSTMPWDPADATPSNRLAIGDKYLDSGTLYAAKFNGDGTGEWLELTFGMNNITAAYAPYAFADQADVALHSRIAADAAGATKMDRPEWAAVDPVTHAVYLTLTNNSRARPLASADAANPRHYNDPPSTDFGNANGHVIRWLEPSPEATTFTWDIYLFGAAADADAQNVNVSGLVGDNDFSSPDGLWFSEATNILWIQTDDGAFTDVTNCMMLAALPGAVGDGAARTITNADSMGATRDVTTRVGAAPGAKLKRFLVGPVGCEITGVAENGDGTALFVNIQHPGEITSGPPPATPDSTWPDVTTGKAPARPRSATVVITKNGGGKIGL